MTTVRGVADVLIRCVGETNVLQNDDALQLPDRKEQRITLILISALGHQAEQLILWKRYLTYRIMRKSKTCDGLGL